MKNFKKKTLLKGEGANQHTLYGKFKTDVNVAESNFTEVLIERESHLKHEQPNGSFAEHKGLMVDTGRWVMGRQMEYNPFTRDIRRVFD